MYQFGEKVPLTAYTLIGQTGTQVRDAKLRVLKFHWNRTAEPLGFTLAEPPDGAVFMRWWMYGSLVRAYVES